MPTSWIQILGYEAVRTIFVLGHGTTLGQLNQYSTQFGVAFSIQQSWSSPWHAAHSEQLTFNPRRFEKAQAVWVERSMVVAKIYLKTDTLEHHPGSFRSWHLPWFFLYLECDYRLLSWTVSIWVFYLLLLLPYRKHRPWSSCLPSNPSYGHLSRCVT